MLRTRLRLSISHHGLLILLVFIFSSATNHSGFATASGCQDELPSGLISIGKLRDNLKDFLKNSKRDKEPEVQRAALFNLCQLHICATLDPRYEQSETLQGIRATAASRLRTWVGDYKLAQKRLDRKSQNKSNVAEGIPQVASKEGISADAGNANSSVDGSTGRSESESGESELLATMHGYEWSSYAMGTASGGPSQVFNYLYGSAGPPWDHAEDLVSLIEDTIDPDSWRRNGGTASIRYHRPQLALVVTAKQEVHDRIYQLLWQLRAMN